MLRTHVTKHDKTTRRWNKNMNILRFFSSSTCRANEIKMPKPNRTHFNKNWNKISNIHLFTKIQKKKNHITVTFFIQSEFSLNAKKLQQHLWNRSHDHNITWPHSIYRHQSKNETCGTWTYHTTRKQDGHLKRLYGCGFHLEIFLDTMWYVNTNKLQMMRFLFDLHGFFHILTFHFEYMYFSGCRCTCAHYFFLN